MPGLLGLRNEKLEARNPGSWETRGCLDSWGGSRGGGAEGPDSWVRGRRRLGTDIIQLSVPPPDHAAMPPSGRRAALLLLPPLLLLRAVLAVPLERGASKEESPATESPVSGPALLSSQVFAVVLQFPQTPCVDTPPTDAAWSLPVILCSPGALTW